MKLKRLLILICTLVFCLCMGLAVVGCDNDTPGPDQGQTPGGQTPGGQTPGGETPGGETPGGETPGGETPGGQTPGGQTNPDLEPFEGNPPICLQHSWGEGYIDVVKKTCTEDGKQVRTCSVCQRREVRTIKSTGHNLVEVGGKKRTCTEGGYEDYVKCTLCDYNTKDEEGPLGHELENVDAKEATCTQAGWTAYKKCTRSGCDYTTLDDPEVESDHVIPMKSHEYESEADDAKCKYCGKTRYIGSKGLEIVAAGTTARVTGLGTCTDTVITIPEDYEGLPVTDITDYAFSAQKPVDYYSWDAAKKQAFDEKVVILNKVTEIRMRGILRIGTAAFNSMQLLETVDLGENLQRLGSIAFSQCPVLKHITIPATCSYIEGDAFFRCDGLESVSVEEGNEFFSVLDEKYLYTQQTGQLKYACLSAEDTVITIPEEIKSIGYYAFAGAFRLQEVTIPGTVESINGSAFFICSGLTKVTIEAGVKRIEAGAFFTCSNLSDVTINVDKVTTTVEGQEVESLSLETIYKGAFQGCFKLTEIKFNGSKADWQKITKQGDGMIKGEAKDDNTIIIKCTDGNLKERTVGDFVDA